jgi:hypothetical protein
VPLQDQTLTAHRPLQAPASAGRYPQIRGRVLFGHRRKVQDSLRCVGGVAVLLPFLAKLSCPIEPPSASAPAVSAHDRSDVAGEANAPASDGSDVGGAVLSFFSECFRSTANCEDAVRRARALTRALRCAEVRSLTAVRWPRSSSRCCSTCCSRRAPRISPR